MTRPLKILRIADIPDNRTGGMSRYIHFVSDELLAAGHTVDHVFAQDLRANSPDWGLLSRFITPLRVVRAVRARLRAGNRYDVIEVHEPSAAAYALARRGSRLLPPLLVSVYALEARGHQARLRYTRVKGRPVKWRSRVGPLSIVGQANLALRLADHVCVETTEDADYLRSPLGIPASRVTMQYGGVCPRFFEGTPGSRHGVLFVGTWIERKGILDLVLAVSALLDRHPGIRVTIAGCGAPVQSVLADFPDRHRPHLRVFPKITDDAILADLYHSHAIFAFPSTFEGLPLVILEAAAAGLAIVTTSVCGMKDTIQDGKTGILVPVGNPNLLTSALDRLVTDPDLATRLGRAARESVRQFTWQRSAQQFLTACLVATSRGGR